jgi:hypothetical protein
MKKIDVLSCIRMGGVFVATCYDKQMNLKWATSVRNLVPTEAITHLLTILLKNGTVIDPWYVAIYESNAAPAAGDTYAAPGATESTAYSQATRPEFIDGAVTGGAVSNSASKAVYSINATKTIYGAALVGGGTAASTKGDTAGGGTLLCRANFDAAKAVESGDTLNVQYTFGAADDGV